MKAMIYAGIGLFSVATIYGITGFYTAEKSGMLKKLYYEEPLEVRNIQEVPTSKKNAVQPKIVQTKNEEPKVAKIKSTKQKQALKKADEKYTKRRINLKQFSRSRIEEMPLPLEPIKPISLSEEKQ
ncbi:MAG: hypothetical protein ACOYKE_00260 [Ferruginibacter sp.]